MNEEDKKNKAKKSFKYFRIFMYVYVVVVTILAIIISVSKAQSLNDFYHNIVPLGRIWLITAIILVLIFIVEKRELEKK